MYLLNTFLFFCLFVFAFNSYSASSWKFWNPRCQTFAAFPHVHRRPSIIRISILPQLHIAFPTSHRLHTHITQSITRHTSFFCWFFLPFSPFFSYFALHPGRVLSQSQSYYSFAGIAQSLFALYLPRQTCSSVTQWSTVFSWIHLFFTNSLLVLQSIFTFDLHAIFPKFWNPRCPSKSSSVHTYTHECINLLVLKKWWNTLESESILPHPFSHFLTHRSW